MSGEARARFLSRLPDEVRASFAAWQGLDDARAVTSAAAEQGHELDSVMALLGSEFDVSVRRLLGPADEDAGREG